MDEFIFTESAFKHGFTRADVFNAFEDFLFQGPMLGENVGKYLTIGFSVDAVLIEVIYEIVDNGVKKVFHIMSCRKYYRKTYLGGASGE